MNKKRREIFNKTGGKCYYCGCDLPERWHADHVEPIRRDFKWERVDPKKNNGSTHVAVTTGACEFPHLDTVDNQVPACPRCNIRKSTMDVETFRGEIKAQVERLLRDSNPFRLAVDFGLVEIKNKSVEFYFERED